MFQEIESVHSGWTLLLEHYQLGSTVRTESRFGVCLDLPGVTIRVKDSVDQRLPNSYPLPELVREYRDRILGDDRERSLIYQRLTKWKPTETSRSSVDQLGGLQGNLSKNPESRAAIFCLWNPLLDADAELPPSPMAGSFRQTDGALSLFLLARSTDVVTGFVPEILGFAALLCEVASKLNMKPGSITYHAWSLHMYENDFVRFQANGS